MHKFVLALASLACTSHGRRVQTSIERLKNSPAAALQTPLKLVHGLRSSQSFVEPNRSNALGSNLVKGHRRTPLDLNPAAGFHSSRVRPGFPDAGLTIARSHPTGPHRLLKMSFRERLVQERTFAEPQPAQVSAPSLRAPVSKDMLLRVQNELWRTDKAGDTGELVEEQGDLIWSLLGEIEQVLPTNDRAGKAPPMEVLNRLIAPHLPLLLGRSFPVAARTVLENIKTEGQRMALLEVCQYVTGVHEEIGDALVELEWQQQMKLRDLCDAAREGGTERLCEMARAMHSSGELDTEFCNYLNYAIEQEENELRAEGVEPFEPKPTLYGITGLDLSEVKDLKQREKERAKFEKELQREAKSHPMLSPEFLQWKRVVENETLEVPHPVINLDELPKLQEMNSTEDKPFWTVAGDEDVKGKSDSMDVSEWRQILDGARTPEEGLPSGALVVEDSSGRPLATDDKFSLTEQSVGNRPSRDEGAIVASGNPKDKLAQQQWLLVLRLVRQGVYSMLAVEYRDDVSHIRSIIGLNVMEARREMTRTTLISMPPDQQKHFENTLRRITENLSVQTGVREREMYEKLLELNEHVRKFNEDMGSGPRIDSAFPTI